MTGNRPQKPRKPIPRTSSPSLNPVEKPYAFVSFPRKSPLLQKPAGHDKYKSDRIHGSLFLTLTVRTPLHVSTGVVAMVSDIDSRVPLIKTMVQGTDQKLILQGSSLKGCIRAVYEAITQSCICKTKAKSEALPKGYRECRIDRKKQKTKVCDACQIFGALNWQGLVEFSDAKCENVDYETGFMPSLYRPRPDLGAAYFDQRGKVAGRKFYYHTNRAIDKGQNRGIPVQQAAAEYTFTTQIQFKNLTSAELGTLLIVLGQDSNYPIALKVGGGKPIGMGTMTATVTAAKVLQNEEDLRDRYSSYNSSELIITNGAELQQFVQKNIQAAHSSLVQATQLQQIAEILKYPTNREPPTGMY
ncbi:MAG: RAMP superfamily CRISPR-associated protein [Cyanobacteriota bacterium]|nr:RAMP superfamily CRISPR-associated protein [Cyanobacteriota bacterium]